MYNTNNQKTYWGGQAAFQAFPEVTSYRHAATSSNSSSNGYPRDSPPPPPRRRSHRPRGCRGGRKNRKNKQAAAAKDILGSPLSQRHNAGNHGANNNNLSALPPTLRKVEGKAWNISSNENGTIKATTMHNKRTLPKQVLPPFYSGSLDNPFTFRPVIEALETTNDDFSIRMLPSFSELDDQSIIPPADTKKTEDGATEGSYGAAAKQDPLALTLTADLLCDESTITTTLFECPSGESSICSGSTNSYRNQRIQQQREILPNSGTSLFVTSPRSFLFGAWDSKKETTGW